MKRTVTGSYEWNGERWQAVGHERTVEVVVLSILEPDETGVSNWVSIDRLREDVDPEHWGRISGNGSNMFNPRRGLGRDFIFDKEGKGRIVAVRSLGLVCQIERHQSIRSDIHREISARPCVILATHQAVEVDHKNGRKNDRRLEQTADQMLTDFQPLSVAANIAKRTHCQRCAQTGRRFDATQLGYSRGWWVGSEAYQTCNGCYWHDPVKFNREISRSFDGSRDTSGAGAVDAGRVGTVDGAGATDLDQGPLLARVDEGRV